MNKIKTSSRVGQVSALIILILKAFAQKDWSFDTYLSGLISLLKTNSDGMTIAINKLQLYSSLGDLNKARESKLRSLFKMIDGYLNNPLVTISQPAEVINTILLQYKSKIFGNGYSIESAEVTSLLTDLSAPTVLYAISALPGTAEAIADVQTLQDDFEESSLLKADHVNHNKELSTATDYKEKILKEVNDNLIGYLSAMRKANPDEYKDIAGVVAELIDANNEQIRSKKDDDVPTDIIE